MRLTVRREEAKECLLCGESFGSQGELENHVVAAHELRPEDEKIGALGWILAIPLLLWELRWVFVGILIVVFVVLGTLGVFDKETAPESRSCPGYYFARDLKRDGEIDSFRSVEPEEGWLCEYELDDVSARFRTSRDEVLLETEGRRSSSVYEAVTEKARAEGYTAR